MLRTLKHSFFALLVHIRRGNQGALIVRAALLTTGLLLVVSVSYSQTAPSPTKQQATSKVSGGNTEADKRGTKDSPLIIQLNNTGKSDAETAKEQQNIDRDLEQKRLAFEQQKGAEERVFWLTIALVAATVLQIRGIALSMAAIEKDRRSRAKGFYNRSAPMGFCRNEHCESSHL